MPPSKPTETEFVIHVCISAVFVVAGFALLLLGQESSAKMAAVWLGTVLGFWLH
jgi:hypothetical protein